jgi:hypothetical protein
MKYSFDGGVVIVECSDKSKYPDFELRIDGMWTKILAKDYIIEYNNNGEKFCFIALALGGKSSYWLLGDAFLNGYYSIHDNDDHSNAKIGIAPHASS